MAEDTSERQEYPPPYSPSTQKATQTQYRQQVRQARTRNIDYNGIFGGLCVLLVSLVRSSVATLIVQ